MKRVADRYFRINEPAVDLAGDPPLPNQRPPGEGRSIGEGNKNLLISASKDEINDNLTAIYWG